jgi:hypothetical protein
MGATVYLILDKPTWMYPSENCPAGVQEVFEDEFLRTYKTNNPDKFKDDPDMDPEDHPDYKDDMEDSRPGNIYEMEYPDQLMWAYKVLKANDATPENGDVIWIGGDQYRNMGIHFWDAKKKKIVPMETNERDVPYGDYGHVPKTFPVGKGEGEFSPDHWDGISYYNNLEPVWSSKKKTWIYPSEGESDTD